MDYAFWLMIIGTIFVFVWIPLVVLSQKKIHPKALFTLFFAELWERFSFYGMRALLMLYMTKVLFEYMGTEGADVRAYGIYGAYGALVYGMPVIGGLIADKLYGFRKAIMLGGLLMAAGHFVLGLEGLMFEGNFMVFFVALGLIIVGNGFFKPNISSFLGKFYELNDPRKDGAFTIFYMGVNIGAFLSPLWCGYLGEMYGWHWGFGLAGVGMLIGVIVFAMNKGQFGEEGLPPDAEKLKSKSIIGISNEWTVIIATLLAVPLFALLLDHNSIVTVFLPILIAGVVGYIFLYSLKLIKEGDKVAGQRLWVVLVLFFFHALFWALFEQAGGSLMLFADRNVDRMGIPSTMFQSLNPLYIMLLAPLFSSMWLKLNKRKKEPSTPMKFFWGLFQIALGYGMIVLGAKLFGGDGMLPLVFLFLMYFFHTTGELSLSPVGLSMVTKLSPPKIVGFVMGAWFLSISLAHEIAAQLGKLAAAPPEGGDLVNSMNSFVGVYLNWGVLVVGAASLLLLCLVPILKKWMHGIH